MATPEMTIQMPRLGEPGEPCADCGTPLAEDQRYCLTCGARRTAARVAYEDLLTRDRHAAAADAMPAGAPQRDWTPMIALGALGGLAIVLIIGVLIGKTGFGDAKQAAAPQVIRVGPSTAGPAAAGTPVASTTGGAVKSDWPSGKEGYTVELGVLPKASSDAAAVQKAKSDALGKGAAAVGALDSDQFKSLPGGNYVVYSGVFTDKKGADAALKKLKAKFPSAQVVQVSSKAPAAGTSYAGKQSAQVNKGQLQNLSNLSGDQYAKQSHKLPTTTVLPGKPPPVDNGAPGGGSGGGATIK